VSKPEVELHEYDLQTAEFMQKREEKRKLLELAVETAKLEKELQEEVGEAATKVDKMSLDEPEPEKLL